MRASVLALVAFLAVSSSVAAQLVPQVPRGNTFNPELETVRRHYEAGWQLFRHEDWAGAVKEFQQVIDITPKFAEAYYSLGRAEVAQRHFVKAIDAYTKCRLAYLASAGDSLNNQVNGTRRLEDQILEQEMALRQAQQSTSKSQSQTAGLYVRQLTQRIDQLKMARDRNQNLVVDTTVPFWVPLSLGAAYFRSDRFEDAEREFKTAIEANAKSGEAHNNLAVLYMERGRIDEAFSEMQLAEKTGFKVNPQFKEDLEAKRRR